MPFKKTNQDTNQPGPGTYTSKIYSMGTEGKRYGIYSKTRNAQGI